MNDSNRCRREDLSQTFGSRMRGCVDNGACSNGAAKDGHRPVDHSRTGFRIAQRPRVVHGDDPGDARWRNDVIGSVDDESGSNEPVDERAIPMCPHSHGHCSRIRETTRAGSEWGASADEIWNHTDFIRSIREFVENSLDGPPNPCHRTVQRAGVDGDRDHRAQRRWTNRSMGSRHRFKEK
jgi:hypothetical protein